MPNSSNLAVPKSSTIVRASGCTWGSFISHHLAYRLPLPCQFTQDRLSQVAFRVLLSSSILSVPKPLLGQRASCRIGAAILAFTRRISCVACWKLEVVAGRTCSDRKLNQTGRARYDHHKQLLEISHFTSPPHQSSQDYSARGNAFDIPLSFYPRRIGFTRAQNSRAHPPRTAPCRSPTRTRRESPTFLPCSHHPGATASM